MIDCADRTVLAWRFAKRITAEDLAALLREAVFRRFGEARAGAQGIEFLSDNGPEYTSHRFRPVVQAMGLIPCHTPRRSPESNGLAEAFFGSFKRDDVDQACLETLEAVAQHVPGWMLHYHQQAPHSALGMRAPAEAYAAWVAINRQLPVQISLGHNTAIDEQKCLLVPRGASSDSSSSGQFIFCGVPKGATL